MEECIEHFSHEHPLSSFQVGADEDPKPYRCNICGFPILSTPSYTCSVNANANCNFFLHKPCATLPKEFDHELHFETLSLEESMHGGRNFVYRCWNHSDCEFDVHPLVAKPVEIKSQHKSHKSHPLVAFCREIVSLCDGCGEEEKGFFYHCHVCNFWIHQDCTILPSVMKLEFHPHPFILAYSLPVMPSHAEDEKRCSICSGMKWRLPKGGVYFCGECYLLAHVACAKPITKSVISDAEILHLPDEEEDTFPSLAIRRFVERRNSSNIKVENEITTEYHPHPLILEDACMSMSDENAVCDVCIQPINMRFYRCHVCQDFVAHRTCANHLPDDFQHFLGQESFKARLCTGNEFPMFFNSVSFCCLCIRPCNGFSYNIELPGERYVTLDIECASAPRIVKHASHNQHILFLNSTISKKDCILSCCSAGSNNYGVYRCAVCDYSIHMKCSLLPKTTHHKFDDHPLHLIMNDHQNHITIFCEVCEENIDIKWWYYGCGKCEQYFHVDCIPSVGLTSKVKFGKTHFDHKLHRHPVALTRMLTHQRHERCGLCNQIIKGFSDGLAFHCSPCHFWIHFSCAAATTPFIDYSKLILFNTYSS